MDDRLYIDPELVQFYDLENEGGDDVDFIMRFVGDARSVLDLGCGTGALTAMLADGRAVTGADPAPAMLDVARKRPGGEHVEWVEGDARSLRLGKGFDLVLLTGHAFQVFLTEEDQRAALDTIAAHLAPGGCFIFDSRNPLAKEWLQWGPDDSRRTIAHPTFGLVEAWNDAVQDAASGIVTYDTFYRVPADGWQFHARSRIAFPAQERLAAMMTEAGLAVDRWLGSWQGAAYAPDMGEIIPIGRKA
ncbi:methyltransferase domain-containing protein [Aminobacter carboxidus]|uniref:Methyltransferase domain-containing protein n=1 Tax=Aminobacter carboxidus TaxID=376165 RepID=A0ABR9GPH3_9HYPH|nr:methyltransferase domain-containing protein [Aminobacter carboxidus]